MSKPQQQPNKQAVREWLYGQIAARKPPPEPAEIRRELGWSMLANNKQVDCRR